MKNEKKLRAIVLMAVASIAAACATPAPPVIDKLDENTGVTVTYSRTPFVFAPDEQNLDGSVSEYVEIGMIEVNTMGTLRYYVWMGVSEASFIDTGLEVSERFKFVEFNIDGSEFRLDSIGSSHEAIGTSEPVYDGLFKSTEDVYFDVTLDQVGLFANATDVRFRNAEPSALPYVPWYRSVSPKEDLAEFYRIVRE